MSNKGSRWLVLLFLILLVLLGIFSWISPSIARMIFQNYQIGEPPWAGTVAERIQSADSALWHFLEWRSLGSGLATFFFMLFGGIMTMFFFPLLIRCITAEYRAGGKNLVRLVLLGFLGIFTILALGLLGFLSFLVVPLSMVFLLMLMLGIWMGWVALAWAIGEWVTEKIGLAESLPILKYGTGLLVLTTTTAIPIIGWLPALAWILLSLGGVAASKFGTGTEWSLKELQNP